MKSKFFLLFCIGLLLFCGCKKDKPLSELNVHSDILVFDDRGNPETEHSFLITSNVEWLITPSSEWCHVDISGGSNNKNITISLDVNNDLEDRFATIDIESNDLFAQVKITQKASANIAFKIKDPIFRNYCLEQFDLDQDDYLSESEAALVQTIMVSEMGISSLEGIQCFPNLIQLNCNHNALTALDVGNLLHISVLECTFNDLKEINASGCHMLESFEFSINPLEKVNISGTALKKFIHTRRAAFKELIAQNCPDLTEVECFWNQMTNLDLSGCSALEAVTCFGNQIHTIELAGCTNLRYIRASENQLRRINLNDCISLEDAQLDGNQLSSLDLSNCAELSVLNCGGNLLKELDMSSAPKLINLICSGNQLGKINLRNNPMLINLSCMGNLLETLDLTSCPVLTYLSCSENRLVSINTDGLTKITNYICGENQLIRLDLTGQIALIQLSCVNNELTEIDVSDSVNLAFLWCDGNPDLKMVYVWDDFDINKLPLPEGVQYKVKN